MGINDSRVHSSWDRLTYSEIKTVATEPGSVAVVPVGSLEQHGKHLPVGTDTLLVEAVARKGINCAPQELPVLTTPPIWSGYSPHHMSFGGTVTLEPETMLRVLTDVADSVLTNGFDALLLLNGHGGNAPLIDCAVSVIGASQPNVQVLGLSYFDLAAPFIEDIRESDPGGMAHGGEFETSLMMYLYHELVRRDEIEGTPLEEPYDLARQDLVVGGPLSIYREFQAYSETGAIGSPELASTEKGRELFDRLGVELATLLTAIHDRNS